MQNIMRTAPSLVVPILLAIVVFSGVIFPQLAAFASPFVFPALFFLLTFSLSLSTDQPVTVLTKPDPAVWGIMLWQMAFIPLMVILVGWGFQLPADLHLMLLATAVSGTVFAAASSADRLAVGTPSRRESPSRE